MHMLHQKATNVSGQYALYMTCYILLLFSVVLSHCIYLLVVPKKLLLQASLQENASITAGALLHFASQVLSVELAQKKANVNGIICCIVALTITLTVCITDEEYC